MVEYGTEELKIDGLVFPFQVCRKVEDLDDLSIDHVWMNTRHLYGQRKRSAPNRQVIIDYWWTLCNKYGTASDPEVQESFILANILPHARSNASRRVFADAHLTRPEQLGSSVQEKQEELESLLRSSRQHTLSMVDFKNRTADILGPSVLSPEVKSQYLEFTSDFLGQARAALVKHGSTGVQATIDKWQQLMRRVGRHAGNALKKEVLDILSYECRAAFHRCYSVVWRDLIPRLSLKYDLSPENQYFLDFWHLDHCSESAEGQHALFHLFHAHIVALHPVGGAFLQAPTGRGLVADWLRHPTSADAFGRLLHGIQIALYHYAEHRETGSLCRRT